MQRRDFLILAAASVALVPTTVSATGTIHITVKTLTGKSIGVNVKSSAKILDIKEAVFNKEGIPTDIQKLIVSGQVLDNSKTLNDYSIVEGTTLYLVLKLN